LSYAPARIICQITVSLHFSVILPTVTVVVGRLTQKFWRFIMLTTTVKTMHRRI